MKLKGRATGGSSPAASPGGVAVRRRDDEHDDAYNKVKEYTHTVGGGMGGPRATIKAGVIRGIRAGKMCT